MKCDYVIRISNWLQCHKEKVGEVFDDFHDILTGNDVNFENYKEKIKPILDFILENDMENWNYWHRYESFKSFFCGEWIDSDIYQKMISYAATYLYTDKEKCDL